jgi:hypothetical protein
MAMPAMARVVVHRHRPQDWLHLLIDPFLATTTWEILPVFLQTVFVLSNHTNVMLL